MRAPPCARAASAASSSSSSERLDDSAEKSRFKSSGVPRTSETCRYADFSSADVDERRLHSRQHALDAALVDVAGDATLALPLDVELAEETVFDERDARFGAVGVDDQEAVRHTRL